jgi:hypothetical protein
VVLSTWLTAVRLERLCIVVTVVPSSQLGSPVDDVLREAYDAGGGALDEIGELVTLLKKVGLCAQVEGVLRRTREGDRVAKAMRAEDRTLLGRALIRAGILHDQARHLVESGSTDAKGNLRCELRVGRTGAPQLLGLLQWWPEVEDRPSILIPKTLMDELNSVWALLPPQPETPTWVMERKAIGNRAEMYTVQIERLAAADPSTIAWVARDSDTLGWDVEDRAVAPLRRIEVKGSRETDPVFFLSDNEWKKASEHATAYEIHFWGGIDLSRQPAEEFQMLRSLGFPIVVTGIIDEVARGVWCADAVRWRVYRAAAAPPVPGTSSTIAQGGS